jgi:hypothetical protein
LSKIHNNGKIHACVAKGGEVKDIVINQMQSTEAQLSSNAYILEVAQPISVFANTLHPPLQVIQNSQPKHSVLDLLCCATSNLI